MKNIYKNSMLKHSISLWIVSLFVLLFTNVSVAQVFKPFQQRTSSQAPGDFKNKQIYNLRGDFKMIGNSNLSRNSTRNASNNPNTTTQEGWINSNEDMYFIDVDNDNNTTNSSRAELTLPANCSNVVYAGLYWSGRRNNNTTSNTTSGTVTNNTNINLNGNNLAVSITTSTTATLVSTNVNVPVYKISNANLGINYEVKFESRRYSSGNNNNNNNNYDSEKVYYRTSSSGAWIEIDATFSGGGNSDRRSAKLSSPIVINSGNYILSLTNITKRKENNATVANDSSDYIVTYSIAQKNTASYSGDKINIKFKKDGKSYENYTADDYYIGMSGQDDIFTAYKDVTTYVKNNGVGTYYGADIDLIEGDGSSVGYFGGWGLVVIYENPTMKWRDITVFDGYAYVSGGYAYDLPLSGFHAAQNGAVNVTMGMMAGEGDRSITGDAFRIRNAANSSWEDLTHTNNTANNFFNSSIMTDGTRFPSYINNTGLDIVKFDLNNNNNSIIANNQTSTKFQYANNGSGGTDTYVIYNVVFAVDAYVPDAEGVNLPQQIYVPADSGTAAQTITNPSAVAARMANLQPGDEVTMKMSLYNYGNENIKDAKIDVNIPSAMRLIKAGVVNKSVNTHIVTSTNNGNTAVNFNQAFWIDPITPNYNPSTPIPSIDTAVTNDGGILRWNIGVIPQQILPDTNTAAVAMSYLEYTLKVTSDCAKLRTSNNECILNPEISGSIEGKGVNSGADLDPRLITGYNNTSCGSTPTYDNTKFTISPSNEFLAKCSEVFRGDELLIEYFCSVPTGATIPRATIANYYPTGTKFYYNNPSTPNFDSSTFIVGDFDVTLQPVFDTATVPNLIGQEELFYAILPGTTNFACYNNIHVLVRSITSKPRVSVFESVCSGSNYSLPVTLSDVGTAKNLTLAYFNSATSTIPLATPPQPTAVGVHKYWVAEASNGGNGQICYGDKVEFSIVIKGCSMKVNPQIYNKFKRP